jgi:hypothetical protein
MRTLYVIGAILLAVWLAGLALRITAGIIHLALVAAAILFILGFLRRGRGHSSVP